MKQVELPTGMISKEKFHIDKDRNIYLDGKLIGTDCVTLRKKSVKDPFESQGESFPRSRENDST